jgi:hypothetical protein
MSDKSEIYKHRDVVRDYAERGVSQKDWRKYTLKTIRFRYI